MTRHLVGINLSQSLDEDPVSLARSAEAAGFDFVSTPDHPGNGQENFEAWTVVCFVAAATSRISVATRVLGVPFRAPAVTAKMAETLSRLSHGRLILGLGAGGNDEELATFGIVRRSPGEKVAALREAVEIIRGLWTADQLSYPGRIHRVERAALAPKPEHPVPIWLGTFGRRALSITGALADGWIPSLGYVPRKELFSMREQVLAAAEQAGRPAGAVECVLNCPVSVDQATAPSDDQVSGSLPGIIDQLLEYVAAGFGSFNFIPHGRGPQRERISVELLPALREELARLDG